MPQIASSSQQTIRWRREGARFPDTSTVYPTRPNPPLSWQASRGPWGSGNYNRAMSDPLAVTSPMLPAMAPLPGVSPHSSKFSRHRAVVDSLGGMPVVRGPRADRYGNVWIMVGRGYGRVARRAVRRARFRFPVQVMEAA